MPLDTRYLQQQASVGQTENWTLSAANSDQFAGSAILLAVGEGCGGGVFEGDDGFKAGLDRPLDGELAAAPGESSDVRILYIAPLHSRYRESQGKWCMIARASSMSQGLHST